MSEAIHVGIGTLIVLLTSSSDAGGLPGGNAFRRWAGSGGHCHKHRCNLDAGQLCKTGPHSWLRLDRALSYCTDPSLRTVDPGLLLLLDLLTFSDPCGLLFVQDMIEGFCLQRLTAFSPKEIATFMMDFMKAPSRVLKAKPGPAVQPMHSLPMHTP
eukprot:scaffold182573_cov18-Tisochrysis_lutea.AAC.2